MIAIVDYGMGNLRSVHKAFERVGLAAMVTRSPQAILDATGVVLPGVGAFQDCMGNLDRYRLLEPLRRIIRAGKPFLGICLGLQVLFTVSEEFGLCQGLGVLKGRVQPLPLPPTAERMSPLKIPHMGWNQIHFCQKPPIFRDVEEGAYFYFVHSFVVVPEDRGVVATTTVHGIEFVSSVWCDNLYATQFHPEKSQGIGLSILRWFGALC